MEDEQIEVNAWDQNKGTGFKKEGAMGGSQN